MCTAFAQGDHCWQSPVSYLCFSQHYANSQGDEPFQAASVSSVTDTSLCMHHIGLPEVENSNSPVDNQASMCTLQRRLRHHGWLGVSIFQVLVGDERLITARTRHDVHAHTCVIETSKTPRHIHIQHTEQRSLHAHYNPDSRDIN